MIGRVYKITNEDESIVYIGSTIRTLSERWAVHRNAFNRWTEDNSENACSIFHHFQEHGIDKFSIHLLSEHEVEHQRQLHEFEQLVIVRTPCVNQRRAHRSRVVIVQENRLRAKQYQTDNWDRIKARNAETFDCGCGKSFTYNNKARHVRTKFHQSWRADQ